VLEDRAVTITLKPIAGLPSWPHRMRLLRLGTAALSLLAVLADLGVAISFEAPAAAYLALLVSTAGVVLAVRHPAWGLVVTVGGVCTAVACSWDPTAIWTIAVFTLFSATLAAIPPFRSGLLVAASLYLLVGWSDAQGFQSVAAVAAATTAVAAAGIGGGLRAQARYWGVLEQRAADTATQAVIAERLRIARDLHDLMGHQVAALNMHLGVAEVSLPAGADRATAALTDARTAVQSVLHETQQILELLRRGDTATSLDDPGQPTPGADQVATLVNSSRQLGLRVEADLTGLDGWSADPAAGITLYRVVQEALTNAARYGDGTARLQLERAADLLTATVSNPRASRPHSSPSRDGYGLIGMRERLDAVGGTLHTRGDDDTFQLTATLPAHPRSRR
jgi:signal transduction histidine kinase